MTKRRIDKCPVMLDLYGTSCRTFVPNSPSICFSTRHRRLIQVHPSPVNTPRRRGTQHVLSIHDSVRGYSIHKLLYEIITHIIISVNQVYVSFLQALSACHRLIAERHATIIKPVYVKARFRPKREEDIISIFIVSRE